MPQETAFALSYHLPFKDREEFGTNVSHFDWLDTRFFKPCSVHGSLRRLIVVIESRFFNGDKRAVILHIVICNLHPDCTTLHHFAMYTLLPCLPSCLSSHSHLSHSYPISHNRNVFKPASSRWRWLWRRCGNWFLLCCCHVRYLVHSGGLCINWVNHDRY